MAYKTAIVFGAGVSAEYGFPLGNQLYGQLYTTFQNNVPQQVFNGILGGLGHTWDHIEEFTRALHLLPQYGTIDQFLEDHQQFALLGKHAIAIMIAASENREQLLQRVRQDCVYKRLIERLFPRRNPSLPERTLAFVTFNYDRSLEEALVNPAALQLGIKPNEAAKRIAEAIPIVHVHGLLAPHHVYDLTGITYGQPLVTNEYIERAAMGIKLPHESLESGQMEADLADVFNGAEHILFLGFGFHPANLKKLPIEKAASNVAIRCSCFRHHEPKTTLEQRLRNRVDGARVICEEKSHNALQCIQRWDLSKLIA